MTDPADHLSPLELPPGAARTLSWVRAQAESLLSPLGDRWRHTVGVAAQAVLVARAVSPDDVGVLVAAGWAHDIGYAPPIAATGFHPLDGARYLARAGQTRLAGLVAHHTGARHEAALRGLADELAEFVDEASPVSDALAYCDLSRGPQGQIMTPEARRAEVYARRGRDSLAAQGLDRAWPELTAAHDRVNQRFFGELGVTGR